MWYNENKKSLEEVKLRMRRQARRWPPKPNPTRRPRGNYSTKIGI